MARKIYQKREFKLHKEPWYVFNESLYSQLGEERYLNELLNPFRQIMANELPERLWQSWDRALLMKADDDAVDRRGLTV